MRKFSTIILLLTLLIGFAACDDDNLFYPKVTTANGITTVSGIRAGGLEKALFLRLTSVTHLVINDTIDSRDFLTMRDLMPNLNSVDLSNATIAAYNGYEGSAGKRVYRYAANAIPEFAFYSPETSFGKQRLNYIKLPQNIKSIKDFAFNHTGLVGQLEIPASVRDTIGRSAFAFCDGLSGVTLSAVHYIGESAFQSCNGLTGEIVIPDSVFIIRPWAFAYCEYISAIKISSTVSDIGTSAFNDCGGIFSVNTSNTNYSASDGVLFNADQSTLIQFPASKGENYTIPTTVTTIGTYSFANNKLITSITIPSRVSSIENYAFSGCSSLSGFFPISSDLSMLGQNVFEGCTQITGFKIAPENTTFSFSNGILTDLSQMTIKRCVVSKTGSYVIASDILFIDKSAFSDCSQLTSITIPESILSIGQRAFYNCTGLRSVYARAVTPIDLTYTPTAFEGLDFNQCNLYVPIASKSAYQSAVCWKNFYNIIEN